MSDIQKRVNDYYNTMYGYGELKPEGVVRQKLDEANERVAELEQQLAESRELENKWLRIAQEFERKNEVLEEASRVVIGHRYIPSTHAVNMQKLAADIDALEAVLEDNDVKGE